MKSKVETKTKSNFDLYNKFNVDIKDKYKTKLSQNDNNENIHLNIFDYFCIRKKSRRYKYIQLFNEINRFYKKKMDIVHVFSLLTILEEYLTKDFLK